MKKLIIIILALLSLCGCTSKIGSPVQCDDSTVIYARKFTFEGHQYIEFYRHIPGYDNRTGFVHDPDCECMIDYD